MSNFNDLKPTVQNLIKQAILDAANDRQGPEGWKNDSDALEALEFESRDGFIPDSCNKGGLVYRNFTDLMGYFGSGHTVAHKDASIEIQRQIDYNFESLNEAFLIDFKDELSKLNIKDAKGLNYTDLYELNSSLAEELSDYEHSYLGGEDSSIMHEFRFMYHGVDKGAHSASVSAAVNTEGPYHRSSISWAPNVFCEGAKEVTIKWRNTAELKRKLNKALKQVSKAIF